MTDKTWLVSIPVEVTTGRGGNRDDAIKAALDDLRDPNVPWEDGQIDVVQTDGPHPRRTLPGQCPTCGHHGSDCTGRARA